MQNGMFEIDPPASDAGSASVGAVANFTCVEGFEVQGDPRECTVDGWSGANPTCGEYTWRVVGFPGRWNSCPGGFVLL